MAKNAEGRSEYVMRAATAADAPGLARMCTLARSIYPLEWACYPEVYDVDTGDYSTNLRKAAFEILVKSKEDHWHGVLALPDRHKIWVAEFCKADQKKVKSPEFIGCIEWIIEQDGCSEQRWQARQEARTGKPAYDTFAQILLPHIKQIVGVEVPHICLDALYVHPEWQRRHVATHLVELALNEADILDLPTYVRAKPLGIKFFSSKIWKFEDCARHFFDLRPFGVNVPQYENALLWRGAKSQR